MEIDEKQRHRKQHADPILPTICFVLIAGLVLFGAVRLLFRLLPDAPAPAAVVSPTPSITAQPASSTALAPVNEVLAVLTPPPMIESSEPGHTPVPPAETAAATEELPQATATSKARTVFRDGHIDVLVIARNADGSPDCIAAVAIRKADCTVLFLPINTVSDSFGMLRDTRTLPRTVQAVESILSVDYGRYISIDMAGVAACIDALGGVSVAGETISGSSAAEMLAKNGSDELLRINTQQKLIDAFLVRLKSAGLIRFAALKAALEKSADGNLTPSQYLKLYQAYRHIAPDDIVYRILPVDSMAKNGVRCYRPDAALVEALTESLYRSSP